MSTTATKPATVDSLSDASRYLAELAAGVGFDEAERRISSRAAPAVAEKLETLKRYVEGAGKPPRELALHGDYFKSIRNHAGAIAGATTINGSLRDARTLADGVRVGLPGDLTYSAVLLFVAAVVSTMWFSYIAPSFVTLFSSIGNARLPAFSQLVFDAPWVVFAVIGVLALELVLLVYGAFRVARAVETMTAPGPGWLRWLAGSRVLRALERWRATTLASAWADAGTDPLAALHEAMAAAAVARGDAAELASRIALANDLGIAAQELAHERERSALDCRVALEVRRGVALRGMQVAVALLVGAIAIAIYLPIFRMGAVI